MGIAAFKKRPKVEAARAAATPSPNSVAAPLDDAPDCGRWDGALAERGADAPTRALPLASLSLGYLYHQLVAESRWDTRFHRGARPEASLTAAGGGGCGPFLSAIYGPRRSAAKRSQERTLATTYLSDPSVDGWNVVLGATELARAWALRDLCAFPPEPTLPEEYDLPLPIRKRLAACLSVSFKFQRSTYSHFPRHFEDGEHSLASPHTKELAHVGFAFMTPDEEAEFGGWGVHNRSAIDALYAEMLALEVELLTSADTFSLLTCNFQVVAEDVLAGLLARGLRLRARLLELGAVRLLETAERDAAQEEQHADGQCHDVGVLRVGELRPRGANGQQDEATDYEEPRHEQDQRPEPPHAPESPPPGSLSCTHRFG